MRCSGHGVEAWKRPRSQASTLGARDSASLREHSSRRSRSVSCRYGPTTRVAGSSSACPGLATESSSACVWSRTRQGCVWYGVGVSARLGETTGLRERVIRERAWPFAVQMVQS